MRDFIVGLSIASLATCIMLWDGRERGMPRRRNYPRTIPRVGKCTYCGGVVYANQAVRVPDPTVTVWDYRKAQHVPKTWLCHRASSGFFCEEYVRERLNKGKVEGHD